MSPVSITPQHPSSVNSPWSDPLELPKTIAKQLRRCAASHAVPEATPEALVRYLWVDMGRYTDSALSDEEWLNIVDEAASLGAKYMIICVGKSLDQCPSLWQTMHWAQSVHGIHVGLHMCGSAITEGDIVHFRELKPALTHIFTSRNDIERINEIRELGIQVASSAVCAADHPEGCPSEERDMLYVGPQGVLYSCGLVAEKEPFELGHALDKPLNKLLKRKSTPRVVPPSVPRHEGGCDGCPPILIKRIQQA